jgi:hypothetical protein
MRIEGTQSFSSFAGFRTYQNCGIKTVTAVRLRILCCYRTGTYIAYVPNLCIQQHNNTFVVWYLWVNAL